MERTCYSKSSRILDKERSVYGKTTYPPPQPFEVGQKPQSKQDPYAMRMKRDSTSAIYSPESTEDVGKVLAEIHTFLIEAASRAEATSPLIYFADSTEEFRCSFAKLSLKHFVRWIKRQFFYYPAMPRHLIVRHLFATPFHYLS